MLALDLFLLALLTLKLDLLILLLNVDHNLHQLLLVTSQGGHTSVQNVVVCVDSVLGLLDRFEAFIIPLLDGFHILLSLLKKAAVGLECPHEEHGSEVEGMLVVLFEPFDCSFT